MEIFKTPEEFAQQMLELCFGNAKMAMCELFHAARIYGNVPTKFFVDVAHIIMKSETA